MDFLGAMTRRLNKREREREREREKKDKESQHMIRHRKEEKQHAMHDNA